MPAAVIQFNRNRLKLDAANAWVDAEMMAPAQKINLEWKRLFCADLDGKSSESSNRCPFISAELVSVFSA